MTLHDEYLRALDSGVDYSKEDIPWENDPKSTPSSSSESRHKVIPIAPKQVPYQNKEVFTEALREALK